MSESIYVSRIQIQNSSNSATYFNILVSGNQIMLSEEKKLTDSYKVSLLAGEAIFRNPIHISEELSAEEWKRSLQYSDDEVKDILKKILLDFELDANNETIELLKKMMYDLIDIYEKKYNVQLDTETRKMFMNLITRMSYDKLCIKQYV